MRKILLITLILTSCSLLESYPAPLQAAQRNSYAGLQVLETNYIETVDYWVGQQIKIITYYENYIAELRPTPTEEIRLKLQEYQVKITSTANEQKLKAKKNFTLVKQLTEAVYNYISTSPLSLDSIPILIDRASEFIKKNHP